MIKLDVKEKGKKYTDKPVRLIAIMEDCRSAWEQSVGGAQWFTHENSWEQAGNNIYNPRCTDANFQSKGNKVNLKFWHVMISFMN